MKTSLLLFFCKVKLANILGFLLLAVALTNCNSAEREQSNLPESVKESRELSEDKLYNLAQEAIRSGYNLAAAQYLVQLTDRFPLGRFYDQAQLDLIFVRYLLNEQEIVNELATKFIELNPSHANTDYTSLILALNKYIGDRTVTSRLFKLEQGTRDISAVRESFLELKTFLVRFPESPYTNVARTRMIVLKEMIARHEIEVALYYGNRNNWVAAVNRCVYLLHNLRGTQYSEWALALLSLSYGKTEKEDESRQALVHLLTQYPETKLYNKKTQQIVKNLELPSAERTFTNILSLGMFSPPRQSEAGAFKRQESTKN